MKRFVIFLSAVLILFSGCAKMKQKKAEGFIAQGKDDFIHGDYREATEQFDQALELLPDGPQKGEILFEAARSYMLLAASEIAIQQDLLQEAEKRFLLANKFLPDDQTRAQAAMSLGMVRRQLGDYSGSVEAYTQATSLFKARQDLAEAHRQRARTYRAWGNWRMAARDFDLAINKFDDLDEKAKIHREMGNMYADAGDFDEALNHLGLAIVRFTTNEKKALSCYDVGMVMEKKGDPSGAIINYGHVLELSEDPLKRSDALNGMGIIYFRTGDFRTADSLFSMALAYAPDNPQRLINSGFTQMFLGESDTAYSRLSRAIKIDPRKKETLARSRELATYFTKFGDSEAARKFRVKLQEDMMPLKLPGTNRDVK